MLRIHSGNDELMDSSIHRSGCSHDAILFPGKTISDRPGFHTGFLSCGWGGGGQ